jgi:uncharacterized radical SAM protein YgiQ
MSVSKVKHLFLQSGLRYDLLVQADAAAYFEHVCRHHVGGQMKVAPEHSVDRMLRIMNKPGFHVYERFVQRFKELREKTGIDEYLVNYFISAHPGATLRDDAALASYLRQHGMRPEQVQDYTPLPLTLSGCMYYTEKHPFTGENLHVAKSFLERTLHRACIQGAQPPVDRSERTAESRKAHPPRKPPNFLR